MSKHGTILIIFAWAMEIVGVTTGAINSIYSTFGDNLPNTVWGYVPAVPMAALAMAEVGRVPLASTIFHKPKSTKKISWRFVTPVASLGVSASCRAPEPRMIATRRRSSV
jgi:hypothetical protein